MNELLKCASELHDKFLIYTERKLRLAFMTTHGTRYSSCENIFTHWILFSRTLSHLHTEYVSRLATCYVNLFSPFRSVLGEFMWNSNTDSCVWIAANFSACVHNLMQNWVELWTTFIHLIFEFKYCTVWVCCWKEIVVLHFESVASGNSIYIWVNFI